MSKGKSLRLVTAGMALVFTSQSAHADPFDIMRTVIQAGQQMRDLPVTRPGQEQEEQPPSGAGRYVGAGLACVGGVAVLRNNVKNGLLRDVLGAGLCLGAFKIAQSLNERDRAAFAARSAELLERQGATQEVWTAPDSGKKITITTGEAQVTQTPVDFALDADVTAPAEGTTVEAATYVVAAQKLNFRSAPTTDGSSNIIGFFNKGDNVEVMGRTPDGQWALVGDEGVVVGYAAMRQGGKDLLITPAAAAAAHAAPKSPARARPRILRNASSGGADIRVAEAANIKTVKVVASTQCKAFSAKLGKTTDKTTGCAQPNGRWAMA